MYKQDSDAIFARVDVRQMPGVVDTIMLGDFEVGVIDGIPPDAMEGSSAPQPPVSQTFLHTISMVDLYDTLYQCHQPVIDKLLYPGVYIYAGPPKVGKSLLMTQVAYHVSTGMSLWGYDVRQGTVLYLALEDGFQRIQDRLYRMFGAECTDRLRFAIKAPKIDAGLDEHLKKFIATYPDTRLIIIDTFQKIREVNSKNPYSYSADYDILSRIKSVADESGVCIILVHHTRKQQAKDPFEMIAGTTGILGCADGALVMQKGKRASLMATLEIIGRDQPDQKLHLKRDPDRLAWELASVEVELWESPPDPLLTKIADAMEKIPVWRGSATDLIALLGEDLKPNVLTRKLNIKVADLLADFGISYDFKRTSLGSFITLSKKDDVL